MCCLCIYIENKKESAFLLSQYCIAVGVDSCSFNNRAHHINICYQVVYIYIRCKCETSLLYFGHVVKQSVSHLPNLNIFLTVILYVKWVYQRKNAK